MCADRSGIKGIFVTGTDTGVGKTIISAALCRYLASKGIKVGVMKPVETGVKNTAEMGPDAQLLAWAAGSSDSAEHIAPYRFSLPAAPSMAASAEKGRIDIEHMVETAHDLASSCDFLIVEGAGGLMVPVAGGVLMADLAARMGLPLLVVARPSLGTINHTLLTVFAARAMELPVGGYIINGISAAPDKVEESTPHTLASLASADLLGVLPHVEGTDREKVEALAEVIPTLPTLPWLMMGLGLENLS